MNEYQNVGIGTGIVALGLQPAAGQAPGISIGGSSQIGSLMGGIMGGFATHQGQRPGPMAGAMQGRFEPFATDPALAAYAAYLNGYPGGGLQRGGW